MNSTESNHSITFCSKTRRNDDSQVILYFCDILKSKNNIEHNINHRKIVSIDKDLLFIVRFSVLQYNNINTTIIRNMNFCISTQQSTFHHMRISLL